MHRFIIVVSTLLVAAPLVAAQPQRHPKPRFHDAPQVEGWLGGESRFGQRGLRGITRYLDLNEDQVEQLTAMLEQNRAKALPLFQGIRAQHERIQALTNSANPDPTTIGNLVLSIHSDRHALGRIHAELLGDFRTILTPEQLSRYEELVAAGPDRRARAAFGALRLLPGEEGFGTAGGPPGWFRGTRRGP
jgi:Spy/CpxP family protein refolding chaperone